MGSLYDNYPDGVDGTHPYFNEPDGDFGDDGALELSDMERLAIAQAFYNVIGDMVSTEAAGNLRDKANSFYKMQYEATGAKSFDVKLLGEKVGTFSLTVSKPTESVTTTSLEVVDKALLDEWAGKNGFLVVDMEAVNAHFQDSGEVPDGCKPIEVITPGTQGGKVTRTTLKVDKDQVLSVLGPQLETASYMLLEGGE